MSLNRKTPTDVDYANYDGAHCGTLWAKCVEPWTCPGCGRNRRQIMRWSTRVIKHYETNKLRSSYWEEKYKGWIAVLHVHHDHISGFDYSSNLARFPPTIVCGNCNAVDGSFKAKCRLNGRHVHARFSFSPEEMRRFVIGVPHDSHIVNYDMAWEIYCSITRDNPLYQRDNDRSLWGGKPGYG